MDQTGIDVWVALFGAVVGGVVTALIAYIAYRLERRQIEKRAVSELVLELSERRAFRVDDPVSVPDAEGSLDFDRLNRSVVRTRESIRATRAELVRHKEARSVLTEMILACNDYLEDSSWEPDEYQFSASELRDALAVRIDELADLRGIEPLVPGAHAFSAPAPGAVSGAVGGPP